MAQIIYRVMGRSEGKRVTKGFRNTDEGRAAARDFVATLTDARTVYDVRTRIAGRVVTRSFKRRRDADAYSASVENDKARGVAVHPERGATTFKEYGESWLKQRHELRPSTAEDYQSILELHLYPAFGAMALVRITPSAVRQWYADLSVRLPGRAHKAYRLLRAIMNTAIADERIVRNPCQIRGAAQDRSAERLIPTLGEVDALAQAMPERTRLLVLLAAWCGLRRGEALALRRQDVDVVDGSVRIERTAHQLQTGAVTYGPPKTDAGHRIVHYPDHLSEAVEDHLARFVGHAPGALLFTGERGGPLRQHVLQAQWHQARSAVGVSYRLHDLRHLGATLAAATGASTRELMRRLGHASPQASLIYQHATEDRDRAIASALAGLALAEAEEQHCAAR